MCQNYLEIENGEEYTMIDYAQTLRNDPIGSIESDEETSDPEQVWGFAPVIIDLPVGCPKGFPVHVNYNL
jgi:hypothetical protein